MKMSELEEIEETTKTSFDFSKLIEKIKAYWLYSLLCAIVLAGLALVYLRRTNPTYNVAATVLIKDDDKAGGGGGGTGNALASLQDLGILQGASNVNNEQNIITSYPLIEKVVRELKVPLRFTVRKDIQEVPLYKSTLPFIAEPENIPYKNPGSTPAEDQVPEYQITFDKKGGFSIANDQQEWKGKWGVPVNLPSGRLTLRSNRLTAAWPTSDVITLKVYDVHSMVDYIHEKLTAEIPDKLASIINLSLPTTVPDEGVDILNALIDAYQSSNVDDNNRFTDSTLTFINDRLVVVGKELDSIENRIQNFKQENEITDLSMQAQALITNAGTNMQLMDAQRVQQSMVNSLLDYMNANKDDARVIPASLAISDVSVSSAIDKYNELLAQKERLLLSTTTNHPMVKNIDEQLAGSRKTIMSGLESINLTLSSGIRKMEQNSGYITNQLRKAPEKERRFVDYSRQQSIKQELYLFLLQKREESLISKSSTLSNSRIVTPGRVETEPVAPNKKLILALALALGLLLPFGAGAVLDMLNKKLRTKKDILERTALPIIGEIGHNEKGKFVVATRDTREPIAEQFRALRANLQFLFTSKEEKVIMLTSSMSGEGKSFLATNLAAVFALADKKVALMEFDLRKPKIMKTLNMKYDKGLSNYIIGAADMEEIILPSGIHENLFIIPAGAIPPNPSELILHERTSELFRNLRSRFDFVIIDTTPNLVSDVQLLGNMADATLYVVRMDYTYKEQLNIADNLRATEKLPRIHLVVNDIQPKRYGGEYRSYGYGNYAEKQLPAKKGLFQAGSKKKTD